MSNSKYACIVDAYSTGAELARELHRLKYQLVHLQTLNPIPNGYAKSFDSTLFIESYIINELNFNDIVHKLAWFKFEFVIAGSEPGVMYAELIGEMLHLPLNPSMSNINRRNKLHMGNALAKARIRYIHHAEINSLEELNNVAKEWNKWPLVIKPLSSAGSDGVSFSYSFDELIKNFNDVYQHQDYFGKVNTSVLLQEFIIGQQYVVNAVSIDGIHKITEIWAEYRVADKSRGNIYDYEIMLSYEGEEQARLIDYTKKVLDALDIKNGPTHAELILDKDGPVLIEVGARMQGGIVSDALIDAIGDSHMTTTLKRFVNPELFRRELHNTYKINKFAMVVNLISNQAGILKANHCLELFQTLPSFYLIARTPQIGDYVPVTVDLITKPGHIYLLHQDQGQLYKDYMQIRQWEQQGKLLVLE